MPLTATPPRTPPPLHFLLFLLLGCPSPSAVLALQPAGTRSSSGGPGLPWYMLEGLDFACTGCSKCCKVKGTVTATNEEVGAMAKVAGIPLDEFSQLHVLRNDEEYASLRSRRGFDGSETCTLLGEDGRCTVYDARPLQCRTYPFWSELLSSREAWDREAVAPGSGTEGGNANDGRRRWDAVRGGCEGINAGEGRVLGPVAALQKLKQQQADRRLLRHLRTKIDQS